MVTFQELLYSDTIPYIATFLLFFAILYFILNRTMFGKNRAVGATIALAISALAVWGLTNYTNYMDEVSYFLEDLEGSAQLIFFGIGGLIIIFFLYFGFRKSLKKREFPFGTFGLAGVLILLGFLPDIVSQYYLPNWIEEYRIVFLVFGIIIGVVAVVLAFKKKDPISVAVKTLFGR